MTNTPSAMSFPHSEAPSGHPPSTASFVLFPFLAQGDADRGTDRDAGTDAQRNVAESHTQCRTDRDAYGDADTELVATHLRSVVRRAASSRGWQPAPPANHPR